MRKHKHNILIDWKLYTVDGKDPEPPGMYETLNMLRGATYQAS